MNIHTANSKAGQSVRYFKGFMAMPTEFEMERPSWATPVSPPRSAARRSGSAGLPRLLIQKDKFASVGKYKPKSDKYGNLIKQHDLFMGGLSGTTRDELLAVLGLAPALTSEARWGFVLSYMGFAYLFKFHSVTEVFHQASNFLVPGNTDLNAFVQLRNAKTYKGTSIHDVIDVFDSELPAFNKDDVSKSWSLGFLKKHEVVLPALYQG